MYTIYFKINYSYGTFNHWYYISKVIRPGDSYSPLDDSELMHQLDERVQLELDEYFYPARRESENCDIDLLIVSFQEYSAASVLSKFDME
jgi:hypothetical protein